MHMGLTLSLATPVTGEGGSPPVSTIQITSASVTPKSDTVAFIEATLANGTATADFYAYVSTSATPPIASDWRDGSGATWHTAELDLDANSHIDGPSGLTASTTYYAHLRYEESPGGDTDTDTVSFTQPAADVVAPVLSDPALTVLDIASLAAQVSTDEIGGTIYNVATHDESPNATQIIAGQDESSAPLDAGSVTTKAVTQAGVQQLANFTGLTEDDTTLHSVHVDAAGNQSNVVKSAIAHPADVTAPIITSVEITSSNYDEVTITFNSNDTSGPYHAAVTTSATPPTAEQIEAGSGGGIVATENQTPVATGPQSVTISSSITASTEYWAYVFQEDDAGTPNWSEVAASPESVTTASETVFYNAWNDGNDGATGGTRSTRTGSQSDPDGGSNAILAENNGGGSNPQSVTVTTPGNAINISLYSTIRGSVWIDPGSWIGSAWARLQMSNVPSASNKRFSVNLDSGSAGASPGSDISNISVVSEGAGWRVTWEIDVNGESDTGAQFQVYFADADNDQSIDNSGSLGDYSLTVYDLSLEDIS